VEVWRDSEHNVNYDELELIEYLKCNLKATIDLDYSTIALFLIKPQSTTLAERLEARKVNNNLNP
jgi:hypothetical protein